MASKCQKAQYLVPVTPVIQSAAHALHTSTPRKVVPGNWKLNCRRNEPRSFDITSKGCCCSMGGPGPLLRYVVLCFATAGDVYRFFCHSFTLPTAVLQQHLHHQHRAIPRDDASLSQGFLKFLCDVAAWSAARDATMLPR